MCVHGLLRLCKYLTHQFRQIVKVLLGLDGPILDFIVKEPHVTMEVLQFEHVLLNQFVFRLVQILELRHIEAEQVCYVMHGHCVSAFGTRNLRSQSVHLPGDAFLAKWSSFAHVDDRLWKVLLAQALLHEFVTIWDQH